MLKLKLLVCPSSNIGFKPIDIVMFDNMTMPALSDCIEWVNKSEKNP